MNRPRGRSCAARGVRRATTAGPGRGTIAGMRRTLGSLILLAACAPAPAPPAPPAPASVPPSAQRDFDEDGFADPQDRCPRERGVAPLGCPPPDSDGDRLADPVDRCPDAPETVNGFADADGCADEVPPELTAIVGPIKGLQFDDRTDALRPKSRRSLELVVAALRDHPDVAIELVGHLDAGASPGAADAHSLARAESGKRDLVEHGIDAARIVTRGAGDLEPLDSNKTASGRKRNRRVELQLQVR